MTTIWGWVLFAWRFEVNLYKSLFRFVTRRPDVPEGATGVRYVGAISVLLWAFVIGSAVELVALHVILPWERVRLAADILGIWGLMWMLGFTASHYVYPHLARRRTACGCAAATTSPSTCRGRPSPGRAPASAASTATSHWSTRTASCSCPWAAAPTSRCASRARSRSWSAARRSRSPRCGSSPTSRGRCGSGSRGGQCAKWRVPVRYIVTPAA